LSHRQWIQSLMQPDKPNMSCCGEADAFEADSFDREGDHYVAIITDGKGMIPNGTRVPVPNEKMKWDAGNPTGHGVIGSQRRARGSSSPGDLPAERRPWSARPSRAGPRGNRCRRRRRSE
jgi:hypothetical protein